MKNIRKKGVLPERYTNTINYAKEIIKSSSVAPYINNIYLFGSAARKDVKWDSDIDIVVIMQNNTMSLCKEKMLLLKSDLSYLGKEYVPVDLKFLSLDDYTDSKDLFIINIKKDAIEL